jgi:hypothetical protein
MKFFDSLTNKILIFSTALFLTASLPGCGGGLDDAYTGPTGTVTGTVKLDGNPVSTACNISFLNLEKGYNASARTGTDGSYELKFKDGTANVPVGKYNVTVLSDSSGAAQLSPAEAMEQSMAQQEKGAADAVVGGANGPIPQKYSSPTTSGLSFEVKEGDNSIDIPLSSK